MVQCALLHVCVYFSSGGYIITSVSIFSAVCEIKIRIVGHKLLHVMSSDLLAFSSKYTICVNKINMRATPSQSADMTLSTETRFCLCPVDLPSVKHPQCVTEICKLLSIITQTYTCQFLPVPCSVYVWSLLIAVCYKIIENVSTFKVTGALT